MKTFITYFFLFISFLSFSQVNITDDLKPNPEKEKKFIVYMSLLHGGMSNIENWKKENTLQYYKELWYYCESFYVRRNYYASGEVLNEEIIDIARFENNRNADSEAIVTLPGFKDVIVLLPASKLIYKP